MVGGGESYNCSALPSNNPGEFLPMLSTTCEGKPSLSPEESGRSTFGSSIVWCLFWRKLDFLLSLSALYTFSYLSLLFLAACSLTSFIGLNTSSLYPTKLNRTVCLRAGDTGSSTRATRSCGTH